MNSEKEKEKGEKGELFKKFEAAVAANAARISQEIKNTGELASLLTKSTHEHLTEEEREKVRAQLLEILKTIPALAIFALPGGLILLPIVFKYLPPQFRPKSMGG